MRARATASTASRRAFRDEPRAAPRSGETGENKQVICLETEADYFLREARTGQITLEAFGKIGIRKIWPNKFKHPPRSF
jgi:hypothetical protein